ncbi:MULTISPECIES: quinone oxidoreductase family protein [Corynebacterium]|uniref:Quinone oxidoreductase n=1 Tax=Corynebacterium aurimucosum TaxID=169292 RepID=A0A558GKU2_9CORY|nr:MULTISPECIES: quinone oxidoreductase [Corynebacterium]MBU5655195.1 quinone oxidoreductase [Corynebacterium aurimucosum]MDK6813935.1 quinone oxidoreductase [Corynebacterium sp. UMB6689]OFL23218.1 NADPH:quinone reductase [Corynebacterium sp. HMSC062A03]OFN16830.1 NADPH:quinone reductase [Corynebacterium sp. HMSC055A01]OFP21314.1 NADPH:quinone reductase [Corynebacterium sp. HMSC066C02]
MHAIQVTTTGGPEVLTYAEVESPTPTKEQLLVDVSVAGVNYIDTYYREGIYNASVPFIIGLEGTGRVVHDPQGEIAPGTMVAWDHAFGSYAEQVCVPRDRVVAVPDEIPSAVAGSMLLQGMTAHYLTHGVYQLGEGASCLITAGAGGVGLILTQMAKALGATVYSVVSTDEKEELAYGAGADHVFRYSSGLAEQVRRHNGGRGVDVVYDGVGKATFGESLEVVRPRGTVALFGAASGPVPPMDPQLLNKHGSIFLTRPSLGAWTSQEGEFQMRAQAVVQAVIDGDLDFRISAEYPLAEAAQAHRDLQERKTTGSIVLRVRED